MQWEYSNRFIHIYKTEWALIASCLCWNFGEFKNQTSCKMLSCNPQISPCGRCKNSEKQGKDKINRQFFAFKEICVIKEKLSVDRFWLYHSSPTWQNVKLYILLARIPYFLSNSLLNGNTGILVLKNKLEGWYSDKYRICYFQK